MIKKYGHIMHKEVSYDKIFESIMCSMPITVDKS